nr:uncharacterized protein LOC113714231 [Coffea arabica]
MADALERAFQNFDLSETELGGVDLSGEDLEEGVSECQGSLVGKLIGEKIANFTGLKNFTNHAWGYPSKMKVTELGPNLFHFHLGDEGEKKKILSGGPWVMDNQLLIVKEWVEGYDTNSSFFQHSFLWIQLWNLPVHWLSRAVGLKIGGIFKSVRGVILPGSGGKEGRHMKIMAEVDITKPLVRGTKINCKNQAVWVEFRKGGGEKREEQYGAWMRAGNIMVSPLKGRLEGVSEIDARRVGAGSPSSEVQTGVQMAGDTLTLGGKNGRVLGGKERGDKEKMMTRQYEERWDEILKDSRQYGKANQRVESLAVVLMEGNGEKEGRVQEGSKGGSSVIPPVDYEDMETDSSKQECESLRVGSIKQEETNARMPRKEATPGEEDNKAEKRSSFKRRGRPAKTSLKADTNGQVTQVSCAKRKADGMFQGTQPIEEDDDNVPKVKVMKLDLINVSTIGEMEASPGKPPKCK